MTISKTLGYIFTLQNRTYDLVSYLEETVLNTEKN